MHDRQSFGLANGARTGQPHRHGEWSRNRDTRQLSKSETPTGHGGSPHPTPPAKWGEGFKSSKRTEYPLPDEYTLDGKTPLDATEVTHLTGALQRPSRKRRRLTGPDNWATRLPITDSVWAHLAQIYTSPMMTMRDTHLHFKHITHRRIATANRFAHRDKACRFCMTSDESSTHLGECPRLTNIFDALDTLARHPNTPDKSREQNIIDRLFAHPSGPCPKALATLYMLAWRYIITDFYRIYYDNP
mmetsp:Transcript_18473/g.52143  ORF Transcript_18473/g.52143 Transcript_18473/m.52143 type:complete len:245 (+) Transcript_18473:1995-2729(+)